MKILREGVKGSEVVFLKTSFKMKTDRNCQLIETAIIIRILKLIWMVEDPMGFSILQLGRKIRRNG